MKQIVILFSSLLLTNCALHTTTIKLDDSLDNSKSSIENVCKNIDCPLDDSGQDVLLERELVLTPDLIIATDSKYFKSPNYYVHKSGESGLNNTGIKGIINFSNADSAGDGTIADITIVSQNYDSKSLNHIYAQLIEQELEFMRGERTSSFNSHKSNILYQSFGFVSPTISNIYLFHNNPYAVNPKTRWLVYFDRVIAESASTFLIASSINDNEFTDTDGKMMILGVCLAIGVRVVNFLGVYDIKEYNNLAKSKYSMKDIVKADF